jgi:predicted Rossmann-fold nucleotide-binding protein
MLGNAYWRDLLSWLRKTLVEKSGTISLEDLDLIQVMDDPAAAVAAIKKIVIV